MARKTHSSNGPHKVLCYYFEEPPVMESVFNSGLRLIHSLGVAPNWMSTSLDKSLLSFRASQRKLAEAGFDAEAFNVYCVPEELGKDLASGFHAFFQCCRVSFSFSVSDDLLSDAAMDGLCEEFARLCLPVYGLRLVLPFADDLEAMGLEFIDSKYHLGGFVRKIYSWNVLNRFHLNRRIGEIAFAEWVSAEPGRGTLRPYMHDSWLWKVPEDNIVNLQNPLREADFIYDDKKHFYPWTWSIHARFRRGDIQPQEWLQLMLKQVQETGRMPPPPRGDKIQGEPFVVDEAAVTRYLKEWGHPAANLPEPGSSSPMTSEQVMQHVLGNLGYATPEEVQIVQGGDTPQILNDAEAAKLLPKKPRSKED